MKRRPRKTARARSASVKREPGQSGDRKSTRLNSSHANISYAVFCLNIQTDLTTSLFPESDNIRLASFALRARLACWGSAAEAAGEPRPHRVQKSTPLHSNHANI